MCPYYFPFLLNSEVKDRQRKLLHGVGLSFKTNTHGVRGFPFTSTTNLKVIRSGFLKGNFNKIYEEVTFWNSIQYWDETRNFYLSRVININTPFHHLQGLTYVSVLNESTLTMTGIWRGGAEKTKYCSRSERLLSDETRGSIGTPYI